MNILITGGAGYIGTELSSRLMNMKEISSIRIYDNLSRKNYNFFIGPEKLNEKVSFIEAELLDSYTLRKEVAKADCVIHLAAKVTTPFSDQNPHLFDQVNNWGTAELCYAVESSDCQKLIYLSSASVYGSSQLEADKTTPPSPKTFYGISKLKGEKHVERLIKKKQVSILRCANVYGYSRSMRFDAVINKFVFDAKNAGRVTIHGNGDQYRSFVNVSRVVDFISALLLQDKTQVYYNLVDRNMTINDIAFSLKEHFNDLEMLYVDRGMTLRQIKVKPDSEVKALIGEITEDFDTELKSFIAELA